MQQTHIFDVFEQLLAISDGLTAASLPAAPAAWRRRLTAGEVADRVGARRRKSA